MKFVTCQTFRSRLHIKNNSFLVINHNLNGWSWFKGSKHVTNLISYQQIIQGCLMIVLHFLCNKSTALII